MRKTKHAEGGLAGMLGEPRSGFQGGGYAEYWTMVQESFSEAGGQDATGMNIQDFAQMYFPRSGQAEGGRIGLAEGDTPSQAWMRDYFYSSGYDDIGVITLDDYINGGQGWRDYMDHGPGKAKGGRIGFQRAGLATLPRTRRVKPGYDQEFTLQKGVSAAPIKQSTVLEEILGGGILGTGASKLLKDKDKPVIKKTKKSKTPETTPPEDKGPDIGSEIVGEVVTQKLLEDLVDVEEINWDRKTGKETSTWKTYKRSDKNRPPTEEELEYDYEELWNDEQSPLDFGSTIAELDAAVAERKAEVEYYRGQYMRGELDKYVKPEVLEEQREFRQKKISKVIEKAFEDIAGGSGFTGTDYKYDAQILADSIAEQLGKGALDELPQTYQTEIYNAAQSAVSEQAEIKRDVKNLSKPTKTLEGIKKTGIINISDPDVADEFSRFMEESDPEGFKDIEEKIQIESFDPKDRKKNAFGGRIGLAEGTDFQRWLEGKQKFDIEQNREELYKEYLEDKRRQKVQEQKHMAADGGRIGLQTGGPPITLQRPMFNDGGLTKTIPPERGPDPQGLPSALYNGIMRPRSY